MNQMRSMWIIGLFCLALMFILAPSPACSPEAPPVIEIACTIQKGTNGSVVLYEIAYISEAGLTEAGYTLFVTKDTGEVETRTEQKSWSCETGGEPGTTLAGTHVVPADTVSASFLAEALDCAGNKATSEVVCSPE